MISRFLSTIKQGVQSVWNLFSFENNETSDSEVEEAERLRERLARQANAKAQPTKPQSNPTPNLAESRFVRNYGPTGPDGVVRHFKEGKLHRDDGPAVIEPQGTLRWFRNGLEHREDGPAIVHPNGSAYWMQNGLPHRLDGPAITHSDGTKSYYIEGTRLSEVQFEKAREARALSEREAAKPVDDRQAPPGSKVAPQSPKPTVLPTPAPKPPSPTNARGL